MPITDNNRAKLVKDIAKDMDDKLVELSMFKNALKLEQQNLQSHIYSRIKEDRARNTAVRDEAWKKWSEKSLNEVKGYDSFLSAGMAIVDLLILQGKADVAGTFIEYLCSVPIYGKSISDRLDEVRVGISYAAQEGAVKAEPIDMVYNAQFDNVVGVKLTVSRCDKEDLSAEDQKIFLKVYNAVMKSFLEAHDCTVMLDDSGIINEVTKDGAVLTQGLYDTVVNNGNGIPADRMTSIFKESLQATRDLKDKMRAQDDVSSPSIRP